MSPGAARLQELVRCALNEIRSPRDPSDFRHCVPLRTQALSAYAPSGGVRQLKSGRLARHRISDIVCNLRIQVLCALASSGAVRRSQSGRLARPWI